MQLSDRIGPFTAVPNWVIEMLPKIGLDGLAMYVYLKMRSDNNGECFPGYDRMQDEFRCSRYKIARMIDKLEVAGLIVKRRRFSASTVYTVISSKIEPMVYPISSKIEPPLVQKSDANKINFNKIDSHNSSCSTDDGDPGPLALLNDAFINTTKIPALVMKPRDVEAGRRLIEAGATPDDVTRACKELLNKGYKKLTGLASVENATIIQIGSRNRPTQAETFAEEW